MTTNLEYAIRAAAREYGMDARTEDLFGRYLGALHSYDPYTAGHCLRVGGLCGQVAWLDGHDPLTLYLMGALHDIGKLAVPRELLNKNGVTPDEYARIKRHTRAGYEILAMSLPYAACAAGKHHPTYAVPEYPDGFGPDERAFADRAVPIVTLADFHDAMTTRNNTKFTGDLDKTSAPAVIGFLEKHFPGKSEDIQRYFRAGIFRPLPKSHAAE